MNHPTALKITTKQGEEFTLFQATNNLWCCPACGSPELVQQPYDEKGSASFEICDCFFQIGYDDNPHASEDAVEGIKNNWHRWQKILLKACSGQADKLGKLKTQLTKIGISETLLENVDQEDQVASNDHYHDPLLTRLYDLQNLWGPDCDSYLSLVKDVKSSLKILDLGCGTGLLTTAFAQAGHTVTGVDPALEMLNIAIRRPFGDKVMWVKANAQSFASEDRFDLIVLSGHAFQVFLNDQDIQAALKTMKEHLTLSGRIAFEIRNPHVKAWENWTPEKTRESYSLAPTVPTTGSKTSKTSEDIIDIWHDIDEVEDCGAGKLVHYNTLYLKKSPSSNNAVKTSATIRFLTHGELLEHLNQAGLVPQEIYGDWDGSPFKPDSREIIVICGA